MDSNKFVGRFSVKEVEHIVDIEFAADTSIRIYVCDGQLQIDYRQGDVHTNHYSHIVEPGGLLAVVKAEDNDVVTYNGKPMALIRYKDGGVDVSFWEYPPKVYYNNTLV